MYSDTDRKFLIGVASNPCGEATDVAKRVLLREVQRVVERAVTEPQVYSVTFSGGCSLPNKDGKGIPKPGGPLTGTLAEKKRAKGKKH